MRIATLCLTALFLASGLSAQPTTAPAEGDASLGEAHWPIGLMLPVEMVGTPPSKAPVGKPRRGDIMVWVPEGAKRIRSVFLIPNNSDSKDYAQCEALRKVATKHEMGMIYMRWYNPGITHLKDNQPDPQRITKLMDWVAQQTGIVEFRHAPWITFGKSSAGEFPFRAAWLFPDRTIASVTYHGETPTWPPLDWAKLKGQTILQVNANGETEWAGTWYMHVRPSLLNYRAKTGWLAHQVVAKGVGHGDYIDMKGAPPVLPPNVVVRTRVWDYLALFMDKALALRVPTDKYPTDGPLQLKQVDEASGYLIDPFAVEEMFGVPYLPLREGPEGYLVGGAGEPPVNGFLALSPLKDFKAGEGVPVVKYESGQSPKEWILIDSFKFAMQADPMVDLGDLAKLMPKVGDKVTIEGQTATFRPIAPKEVAAQGGISLKAGLKPSNKKITLLAYTVLDVPQRQTVQVSAGFTAATRVQLVINGIPVKHKQVLDLQPGQYPLLMALRMEVNWERMSPALSDATEENVKLAKQMQEEADKLAAEQARLDAAGRKPKVLIHKAADVPKEQRAKMFWIPDQEMADAWIKLHTIEKKKPSAPAQP